ncbi:MAG TPA: hypothetical protein VGH08_00750 [Chthoniobacterales bacterium]
MPRFLLCGAAILTLCQPGLSSARHFGYLYEAPTALPGTLEIENYITGNFGEAGLDEIDFRHEFEFGITNHLQAGIYVANWSYSSDSDDYRVRYNNVSVELIYNLTNRQLTRLVFQFTRSSVAAAASWNRKQS